MKFFVRSAVVPRPYFTLLAPRPRICCRNEKILKSCTAGGQQAEYQKLQIENLPLPVFAALTNQFLFSFVDDSILRFFFVLSCLI